MVVKVVGEDRDVKVLTKAIAKEVWEKYVHQKYCMYGFIIEINIPQDATITDEARAFVEERAMRIRRLNFEIE